MPYTSNTVDGVRIYYELIGSGPPLMLGHGGTYSSADWYDLGYVDAFKDDYQLILFDARAHGKSDGPHDVESYTTGRKLGDALAVLDELGIGQSNFFGYSAGGLLGYSMLKLAPERVKAMVIGGNHPFIREQGFIKAIEARMVGLDEGMENYTARSERARGARMPEPRRSRYVAQDSVALLAYLESVIIDPISDYQLGDIRTPCLLYAGTADPLFNGVKRASEQITDAEFHKLEEADHLGAMEQIDYMKPLILEFLNAHARVH